MEMLFAVVTDDVTMAQAGPQTSPVSGNELESRAGSLVGAPCRGFQDLAGPQRGLSWPELQTCSKQSF